MAGWWWNEKVKRAWVAAAARIRARKRGGIMKLQEDVQMCGYEDVQVMWEMVRRSELELKQQQQQERRQQRRRRRRRWKRRSFWRLSGRGGGRTSDWPDPTEASEGVEYL